MEPRLKELPEAADRRLHPADVGLIRMIEKAGGEALRPAKTQKVGEGMSDRIRELVDDEVGQVTGQQPTAKPAAEQALDPVENRKILPTVERQDDLPSALISSQSIPKEVDKVIAIDEESADDWYDGRHQPAGPEPKEGSDAGRRDQMGERTSQI